MSGMSGLIRQKMVGNPRLESPQPQSVLLCELLQLNLGTSSLDSLLQVLSLFLAQTLLNGSGSTVNEILCFLQTKTTSLLNGLYDLEFSGTCRLQDYVE